MSASAQKRKSSMRANVFRFAPRADIAQRSRHVRFVPEAEMSSSHVGSGLIRKQAGSEGELRRTRKVVLNLSFRQPQYKSVEVRHDLPSVLKGNTGRPSGEGRSIAGSTRNPRQTYAAVFISPSCVKAATPSSRPISSTILPSLSFRTVVPVNFILRPVLAGSDPAKKSPKAGPVWVPPPSQRPTT